MEPFIEFLDVPVNSCILLRTREEALAYPRGDIALGFCGGCGFICNLAFDPAQIQLRDLLAAAEGIALANEDLGDFAFDFRVSFFALMLMNGIVNLATTIPSAPGYVGTFDAPGIAVLAAYGVAPGVAAGYTLTLHATLWLPITLLGAYYMAREGLNWNKVQVEYDALKNAEVG